MHLKCIEPSQEEPVTVEEAKRFLRVDHDEEDVLIQMLISTAREYAETMQRKMLGISVWEGVVVTSDRKITVPLWPLREVIFVTFRERDGEMQTLSSKEYGVDRQENGIFIADRWQKGEWTVQFSVGIPREEIPFKTKQAMLLLIGTWYEHREGIVVGREVHRIPFAVEALLAMDRRW